MKNVCNFIIGIGVLLMGRADAFASDHYRCEPIFLDAQTTFRGPFRPFDVKMGEHVALEIEGDREGNFISVSLKRDFSHEFHLQLSVLSAGDILESKYDPITRIYSVQRLNSRYFPRATATFPDDRWSDSSTKASLSVHSPLKNDASKGQIYGVSCTSVQ